MSYKLTTLFLAFSIAATGLGQQACPEIPDTGVEIGEPVPIKPEDIPRGCSPFEILVGMATAFVWVSRWES